MKWISKIFSELSVDELYAIMQLRNEVFVVEQNCAYNDLDDKDQPSIHLMGWNEKKLVAYTRILPPGLSYPEPSIGRVVTSPSVRRTGAGRELMNRSIELTHHLYGQKAIKIGAQLYLKGFYESLGFKQSGPHYLEDGIEHLELKLG